MKSYQIHLIRHGLTAANESGKYVGSTNISLSETGRKKLAYFNSNFKYPDAVLFYTSPLIRCVETMQMIYPNATPIVINALAECSFGQWEGKTAKELADIPMFQDFIKGKKDASPPDGESGKDFFFRITSAFETIINTMLHTGKTSTVIVTHGGIISNLLAIYGLPKANFYDWLTEPGHGYSMRITPSLWMRGKVAEVYAKLPSSKD